MHIFQHVIPTHPQVNVNRYLHAQNVDVIPDLIQNSGMGLRPGLRLGGQSDDEEW